MTNKALQYFLDLKANGATDAEAKAQTEALTSVLEGVATKEDLQSLATKEDLTNLGIRTDAKFDLIKKDLENVTSKNEFNLLKESIDINHRWTMALLIAALGGIVAILCK